MDEELKTLGDYLVVLRRRKAQVLLPAVIIFLLAAAAAFALPAKYRSSATILIEQQEIPRDMVRSSVTSYADQRIQLISQRVMTTQTLGEIITRFGLYPQEQETQTLEQLAEKMRKDISLETISADVMDPHSGRPTKVTIAFILAYESRSPEVAYKVANELVSLFLKENIESRTQAAEQTTRFLEDEVAKLDRELAALEARLADFKERNVGKTPDLVNVNMQLMDRADRQLMATRRDIRSLKEREIYLESELLRTSPSAILYADTGQRILTPEDRYKSLKAQYVSEAARLSPGHPDIIKMKKELTALSKEIGRSEDTTELERELAERRSELSMAEKRYSPDHPDVKRMRRSVASLEQRVTQARTSGAVWKPLDTTQADNPAYIQLQARLHAARTDLKALEETEKELRDKLAKYEQRLIQTPEAEREYRALTRNYENALVKYRETKNKLMQAKLSESLERERKGERFSLIEPPLVPDEPVSPNRPAILVLGMVFSFAGGLGTAALGESLDQTVRDARDLTRLTHARPLAIIARIETMEEQRASRRRRILLGLLLLGLAVGAIVAVHFLFMPLDVLWYSVLRRMGLVEFGA